MGSMSKMRSIPSVTGFQVRRRRKVSDSCADEASHRVLDLIPSTLGATCLRLHIKGGRFEQKVETSFKYMPKRFEGSYSTHVFSTNYILSF